jgi:hypothetical protein
LDQAVPEGPLLVPSGASPFGDYLGDSSFVTELSEMRTIRDRVPSGLCPPCCSRPSTPALALWASRRPLPSSPAAWTSSPILLYGDGWPSCGNCLLGCGASGSETPVLGDLDTVVIGTGSLVAIGQALNVCASPGCRLLLGLIPDDAAWG